MKEQGNLISSQEKSGELLERHERWTIEQRLLINSIALNTHFFNAVLQVTLGLSNFHKNRSIVFNIASLLLSIVLSTPIALHRPKLLKELKEKARWESEEDIVGAISTQEEYENAKGNKKTAS